MEIEDLISGVITSCTKVKGLSLKSTVAKDSVSTDLMFEFLKMMNEDQVGSTKVKQFRMKIDTQHRIFNNYIAKMYSTFSFSKRCYISKPDNPTFDTLEWGFVTKE